MMNTAKPIQVYNFIRYRGYDDLKCTNKGKTGSEQIWSIKSPNNT